MWKLTTDSARLPPKKTGDSSLPVGTDAERPEYVPDGREQVWRCVDCGQHFWRGSHWEQISETLSAV